MRNRTFEEFLRSYPTYYSVANNKEMRHIFENIVSREDNMIKMYLAVLSERPALSAISDEIESYYDSLAAPHILSRTTIAGSRPNARSDQWFRW